MSQWKKWLRFRSISEGESGLDDPGSAFRFNTDDDDLGDDYDEARSELFRVVMEKYPEETSGFFDQIAQRGDEEVAALLRRVKKGSGTRVAAEPRHPSEKPELVASSADIGHNPESEGGGE